MKVIKIAGSKVIEVPFKIKDKKNIIEAVETSLSSLTYIKPKARELIVPGDFKELPDTIQGGLYKIGKTPEGTLYSSVDAGPGIQIEANIFFENSITSLFNSSYQLVVDLHNKNSGEYSLPKYQHSWFFINRPTNREAGFHDHIKFNSSFPHDVTTYTWTTYIQLPDKCKDDEGRLAFQNERTNEIETLEVKLDTLYIFPASLLHRPNLSPNSSLSRITAAANILIPGTNKSLFID